MMSKIEIRNVGVVLLSAFSFFWPIETMSKSITPIYMGATMETYAPDTIQAQHVEFVIPVFKETIDELITCHIQLFRYKCYLLQFYCEETNAACDHVRMSRYFTLLNNDELKQCNYYYECKGIKFLIAGSMPNWLYAVLDEFSSFRTYTSSVPMVGGDGIECILRYSRDDVEVCRLILEE